MTGTIRPPAKKATSVGFLWLWLNIRGKTPKSNGWWSDCHFAYPATLQWIGVYPINGQPHLWVAMAEVAGHFREHGLHAGRFHDSERRHSRQRWDSADLQKWVSERINYTCCLVFPRINCIPLKIHFFLEKMRFYTPGFSFSGVPTKPLPFHWYQPEARPLNLGDIARFGSTNGHKP